MNKLLKKINTFAFLIFVNMQIFGQGYQGYNPFDPFINQQTLEGPIQHDGFDDGHGPNSPTPPTPTVYSLNIMTYNIWRDSRRFNKHKDVINESGAEVVAIQEMLGTNKYHDLKAKTNMDGSFCVFHESDPFDEDYGIVLLWKKAKTGNPTAVTKRIVDTTDGKDGNKKAYLIVEFNDYMVICTHYSTKQSDNENISQLIISDEKVQICKNSGKPIYIAGDFNCRYDNEAIKKFTRDNNYVVLNETLQVDGKFVHATKKDGSMIDLILEYNGNSNKSTLWKGRPSSFKSKWLGKCIICKVPYACPLHVSDHKPYLVKRKYK